MVSLSYKLISDINSSWQGNNKRVQKLAEKCGKREIAVSYLAIAMLFEEASAFDNILFNWNRSILKWLVHLGSTSLNLEDVTFLLNAVFLKGIWELR